MYVDGLINKIPSVGTQSKYLGSLKIPNNFRLLQILCLTLTIFPIEFGVKSLWQLIQGKIITHNRAR